MTIFFATNKNQESWLNKVLIFHRLACTSNLIIWYCTLLFHSLITITLLFNPISFILLYWINFLFYSSNSLNNLPIHSSTFRIKKSTNPFTSSSQIRFQPFGWIFIVEYSGLEMISPYSSFVLSKNIKI